MVFININGVSFWVKKDISILEACKFVGIYIPRFCYHEMLQPVGNCRMCLVELIDKEKPLAGCVTPVESGMEIFTETASVKKARENVIETILLNHPLDCPICDQGGECDLQDQSFSFGSDKSKYLFSKRGVEDKNFSPIIKTIMTRCIHCTRCVRYGSEVAGFDFFGTLNRGRSTEIGVYSNNYFNSEISGNVIDLCPVGALTSKPYSFKARPWEFKLEETIDLTDGMGSNLYANFKESEIVRILPKYNSFINGGIITDKARFSFDSNKRNRILNIFYLEKASSIFYKKLKWESAFSVFDSIFGKKNSKINLLVDGEIGFIDYSNISRFRRQSSSFINIFSISSYKEKKNQFLFGQYSFFNDLNSESSTCFIISANPKLESSILNARLRSKYRISNLSFLGSGFFFESNLPVKFINLNISDLLNLFEGRSQSISKLFLKSERPIILFSNSILNRFPRFDFFVSRFSEIHSNIRLLNISSVSNINGLSYFSFRSLNRRSLFNVTENCLLQLSENIFVKKLVRSLNKNFLWFNSHGSVCASESKIIVPLKTPFEYEDIFLNSEQRPQQTNVINKNTSDAIKVGKFFESLLKKSSIIHKHSQFLEELNLSKNKFEKLKLCKSLSNFVLSNDTFFQFTVAEKYPLKPVFDNFYLSNNLTKNSKTMQRCSQNLFSKKSFG